MDGERLRYADGGPIHLAGDSRIGVVRARDTPTLQNKRSLN